MIRFKFIVIVLLFFWRLLFCKAQPEKASFSIIGLALPGNIYFFEGEINQNVTPYCGDVFPETTSTDTSSSTSSSNTSRDSSQIQSNRHKVSSYYRFQFGDYMQLRYIYDSTRKNFSLSPSTTFNSVCNTIDFINCNASGTAQCETADNIKCGGANTFVFVGVLNPIVFQAVSGKVDWTKGFSLSTDKKYLQSAKLEFEMIDSKSNILKGSVYCNSN